MKLPFSSSYWIKYLLLLPLVVGFHLRSLAQDVLRFQQEVEQIEEKYAALPKTDGLTVFTGSSSIKMWKDLPEYFPDHPLINAGFGGSQTSDLLHYVDELIIQYQPKKVFIYEGDNDISAGKSSTEIILTMDELVKKIDEAVPGVEILLISAKPSISRWHLKAEYEDLNQHLKEYSQLFDNVKYVDIWTNMIDENGEPKSNLFLEDNLHMNKAGYDLWEEVIVNYMD